jgi:hypothetical protein
VNGDLRDAPILVSGHRARDTDAARHSAATEDRESAGDQGVTWAGGELSDRRAV